MRSWILPAIALVVLAGVFVEDTPRRFAGIGGTTGTGPRGWTAPEPVGPLRSPAGRIIQSGTRDELGYVLPLDVKRLKPPRRSSRASNDRSEPLRARRPALFEEHRLGPDDGHTQNETTISAWGDTLVAGWNNYTDASLVMGVARSTDGGHSWESDLFSGHNVMSDPAVKTGRNGKWYYVYLAGGGAGGSDIDIYVRVSIDAGASWGSPVVVTANTSFDDKPYLDARGDEVLVGWADFSFSPAKVRAARSTDGGATFGPSSVLADNSVGGNGACPIIGPDGVYHMFWRDSFQDSLWTARSSDQGASWSPDRGIVAMSPLPSMLPGGFRIVNLPSADANPVSGDLVVVWNDQRFGNADILSIHSTDGGNSWSAPVRVNDDPGSRSQFFPWIEIDEAGVAHVMWYDRRDDGFAIDAYYARSLDGGVTYEPNVRITAQAFTPVLPEDTALDFIGDYNGIAAAGGTAYPFYQDARAGDQDVYVAVVPGGATSALPELASGAGRALAASPNPFRRETTLFRNGVSTSGRIDIFGVDGRRLRTLRSAPGRSVAWDGRDDAGRDLPAGVYFARPGGAGSALRLIKVR